MKKSFMTRALAMGLSLAMAFSLSAATNVSVASAAATPAMASKQFAVRVGGASKSYKASTATQKSFRITKATVGNTDKATVSVNSSRKSLKVTPGTVTGTTVVTVTFKNIKTAKSTAKKYRCVVKAAIEPEKPVEPEVVKATKITEAKAATAKTVSVTFDGVVDTSTATAIKLSRGTIDAPVTVAFATDKKSATLTSATPLAAGTYTLTVGNLESVNFAVLKQTATKLVISSTTVANQNGAGVGFQVLDQYGDPMDSYTAKKLEVKAYNVTKGHDVHADTTESKPYFKLDCATQDVNKNVINSLGDKVSVVAYLKDNASVSATAELTITNIYMESLELGEPEVGTDKRVTVKKTYKLPYTAKNNEGNDMFFGKYAVGTRSAISRTFGDYTFVSSNIAAVDMRDFYIDKDGNMFFTAKDTAGTAVITAINTKTGTTVSTTIVVNDVPTLSRLDVADASVAWDAQNTKVKAEVTAYDQFDEVIDAKDLKNLTFDATVNASTKLDGAFSSVVRVPGDADIDVYGFSNDGKYLIYNVANTTLANKDFKGQSVVFNFTSAKAGTTGYITCKSSVAINDRVEPGALTIVTEPDATAVENGTVKVRFSVLDQYQNKVKLSKVGNKFMYSARQDGSVVATDYYVEVATKGAITSIKSTSLVAGSNDCVGEFELNLASVTDSLYKDGQISVKLMEEDDDQLDIKKYDVKVVNDITAYDVTTDKTSYTAGDTVTVTVNAYSTVDGSYKFNKNFNGSHNVEVVLVEQNMTTNVRTVKSTSLTRKTLTFKDGVATFTATAGTATATSPDVILNKYRVTKIVTTGAAPTSTNFEANNDGFAVVTNSANKIVVNETNGKFQIVDSQGNGLTAESNEKTYAQFIIKDETVGKDITSSCTMTSPALNLNDKTILAVLDTSKQIDHFEVNGSTVSYNMATGLQISIPGDANGHNVSVTMTVNGCQWSDIMRTISTTPTFKNTKAETNGNNRAQSLADTTASQTLRAITGAALAVAKDNTLNKVTAVVTIPNNANVSVTASVTESSIVTSSATSVVSSAAVVGFENVDTTKEIGFTYTGTPGAIDGEITVAYTVAITSTATDAATGLSKPATPINKTLTVKYKYDGSTGKWTAELVSLA